MKEFYQFIFLFFSVEGAEQKQTACYDIDVEVDDTLKTQMNNFLLSTASQQEIQVHYLINTFLNMEIILISIHYATHMLQLISNGSVEL